MQEEDGHQTSPGAWLNIMCQNDRTAIRQLNRTTASEGGITGAIRHARKALDSLGDCHVGQGLWRSQLRVAVRFFRGPSEAQPVEELPFRRAP